MYSPKICRRERSFGYVIVLKIVRYFRKPAYATHEVLHAFPSYRSTDIGDPIAQKMLWMDIEITLLRFLVHKVLTPAEADRIRDAFEAVIPKPAKPFTVPIAKPVERTSKADLLARFPILASGK